MSESEDKKTIEEVIEEAKNSPEAEYHVTSVPATLPENSGSVLRVVPPVPAEDLTDDALDAQIDKLLASPEIDAMLENVAKDAADDIGEAVEEVLSAAKEYQYPVQNPTGTISVGRSEFEEFKARVEKAFKHAGFKF